MEQSIVPLEPYLCRKREGTKEHDSMANEKDKDKERTRALDLAVSQIEKQFGKGAIMKLGEEAIVQDIAGDFYRLAYP